MLKRQQMFEDLEEYLTMGLFESAGVLFAQIVKEIASEEELEFDEEEQERLLDGIEGELE